MHAHAFRTILCPVDFSPISAHALRTASLLSRCGPAKLVAAYANWFEAPPYFTEGRVAELRDEFRESMDAARQSLTSFVTSTLGGAAASVDTRVVEALPADGILRLASESGAGLVVMGTHGRHGLDRWMLGSVAERVLRESAVPVLTVRSATSDPIRRILCAVHDTEVSRRALALAASLSACLEANLTVLHVQEPSGVSPVSDLCRWIPDGERSRCQIREMVRRGEAAEEIVKVASEEDFDLLVLGAPRRRFFEGMVFGTTALRAVRHAPCPVLTVGPGPAA